MMTAEEIIRLYRQTKSIKATTKTTGISEQTVRRLLVDAGEYTSPAAQTIRTLYADGLSIPEIAERLNVSTSTVYAYLPYTKATYATGEKKRKRPENPKMPRRSQQQRLRPRRRLRNHSRRRNRHRQHPGGNT